MVQSSNFNKTTTLHLEDTNLAKEWQAFKQCSDIYMIATEAKEQPEDVKLAMLLNFIGGQALEFFNLNLGDAEENTLKQIMHVFVSYCTCSYLIVRVCKRAANASIVEPPSFLSDSNKRGVVTDGLVRLTYDDSMNHLKFE